MKPQKRIFIGLFLFILAILLLISSYFFYSIKKPDLNVIRYSYAVGALLLTLLTIFVLLTIGYILISILKGIYLPFFNRLAERSVVFLFPAILQLGKLLHITQDRVQRSFIEVNNRLLECRNIKVKPEELLVLLPHCLQNSSCIYKVTGDPGNCHHCGQCMIDPILKLLNEIGVNVRIVRRHPCPQGGQDIQAKCIMAVACERDSSRELSIASRSPSGVC